MISDTLAFRLASPDEKDARLAWQWRNDPDSRAASRERRETPWEEFAPIYHERLYDTDVPPLFVVENGYCVAYLSFRPYSEWAASRKSCEISLIVAPEARRRGIGKGALSVADTWLRQHGYDDIYAEIRHENAASLSLFVRAGYHQERERIHKNEPDREEISLRVFRKSLTPKNLRKDGGVYIIAEAGSNWRVNDAGDDTVRAKELIEKAAEAGADAVKFQVFRPETLYAPEAGAAPYLTKGGIGEKMDELFARLAMPYEMIPLLASYCQQYRIAFLASVFSPEDFDAVDPYVKAHKIASYEIGHLRLLETVAASKKPLLLSTGAATAEEIAWAVKIFCQRGGGPLTLLQCTAKYPAPLATLDLRTIPWLKQSFGVNVGLSDHSRELLHGPLGAVALGASVIEKHYTLDRGLPGPDHPFSIEPHELKELVKAVRSMEESLGPGWKRVHPEEQELRQFARRGIQALRHVALGDVLHEGENIGILRPGNHSIGVHPRHILEMEGKMARRSLLPGEGVRQGDW